MPRSRNSVNTVFVPFIANERPYLRTVLDGIRAYAKSHTDWRLELPYYHRWMGQEPPDTSTMIGQIAGVPEMRNLDKLLGRKVPTVLIGFSPRPRQVSTVVLDYSQTARNAITHFTDQGVRSLAIAASRNERKHDHHELRRGILAEAKKMDVPCLEFIDKRGEGNYHERIRQHFISLGAWLKQLPRQTGVICGDDDYAGRVVYAAKHAGISLGNDILLLGCGNDTVFCESLTPSVSSISLDYHGMGWQAAQKLQALIENPKESQEEITVKSSDVYCRRSSRRTGAPGSFVAQTLDAIWNSSILPSSGDELAGMLGLNRRTLDRHFTEQLGRTVSEELRHARLTMAKQLLENDRVPLAEVAQHCGYFDQAHFSRDLKRDTGKTPSQIRRNL